MPIYMKDLDRDILGDIANDGARQVRRFYATPAEGLAYSPAEMLNKELCEGKADVIGDVLKNSDKQARIGYYPEGRYARNIEMQLEAERAEAARIAAEQAGK